MARYHQVCVTKPDRIPGHNAKQVRRPFDGAMLDGFRMLCHWLEKEGDSKFYTITKIRSTIKEFDKKHYTSQYLKVKLKWRYDDFAYFNESRDCSHVVCFKDSVTFALIENKTQTKKNKC